MKKRMVLGLWIALCAGVWSCGGESALGEACGEEGADGECEDGSVCGKPGDDSEVIECLKQCTEQTDCAADEECNGVSNTSIKGCRPKDK